MRWSPMESLEPLPPQTEEVMGEPKPQTLEDIIALILSATPYDKYVPPGTISRKIFDDSGIYVSPDKVEKIVYRKIASIKRKWTPEGWTYIRFPRLHDFV